MEGWGWGRGSVRLRVQMGTGIKRPGALGKASGFCKTLAGAVSRGNGKMKVA